MGAGNYVEQAERMEMRSKGLSRLHDRCSCHPQAWGLKKGLRRGRRRWGLKVIREEIKAL